MRKTIVIFGLLGPVIGSFVFVSTNALLSAEFHNLSIQVIASKLGFGTLVTLFFSIWGIPFAMLLGAVPAWVSGYAYWVISRYLKLTNPSVIKRFLLGSAVSLIVSTISFVILHGTSESFSYGWSFFVWPGFIAGGVCGLLVKTNDFA